MSKHIVIVGGGYAGAKLAKGLDKKAKVTLVEKRSHFAHSAALIRALFDPSILEGALIPYDNLLQNGQVIHAKATSVNANGVILEDGKEIAGDYIVVATGSENVLPFKPKGADIQGLREANTEIRIQLLHANSVAIVGAGAVGVELAGEL